MSIKMDDRKDWPGRVERKFRKYWMHLLPVPADPIAYIYRTAFSKAEWLAIRYLKEFRPQSLKASSTFDLYLTDDISGNGNCPHVTFHFPKGMTLPDVGIKLGDLPESTQRVFRPWITSVNRFRSLQKELRDRCKGVMGNPTGTGRAYVTRRIRDLDPKCNTPSQLLAVWPEIQPFMLKEWRRDLQLKVQRPRPPKCLGYAMLRGGKLSWTTPRQFRCEDEEATDNERARFTEINEIITMMSIAEEVREPDNYPTFHGPII